MKFVNSFIFFVRGEIILLGDLMRLFVSTFFQFRSLSEKSVGVTSPMCLIGFAILKLLFNKILSAEFVGRWNLFLFESEVR